MSTAVAEVQVIDLDNLEANLLPELQGWREKQIKIVNENPYIPIEDNSTYEEAKKARTALVTARTDVQKQEKTIASKLKAFRTKVSEASQELIDITLPHEEKQQDEVRRYEAIKEAEKAEKERIVQERKDKILSGIDAFYQSWKQKISEVTFAKLQETSEAFEKVKAEQSEKDFEEFEMDFAEKVKLLDSQLKERDKFLTEQEEARKEREKLEKEKARNQKLRPYVMFIPDYDAILNLSDEEFEKELSSLNKQAVEHQREINERELQIKERKEAAYDFLIQNGYKKDEFGVSATNYPHFIGERFYDQLQSNQDLEAFKNDVLKTKSIEEAKAKELAKQKEAEADAEKQRKAREEEEQARHQKTFEIRCNRLEEVGFDSNDDLEFINQEFDVKLEKFHDDVYGMDIEEFEDFIQEAKTELANAKAEAERKATEEKAAAEKAEQEAKERAEAEAKRLEELKPIREKLYGWVDSFNISDSPLEEAHPTVHLIIQNFEAFVNDSRNRVKNLK